MLQGFNDQDVVCFMVLGCFMIAVVYGCCPKFGND